MTIREVLLNSLTLELPLTPDHQGEEVQLMPQSVTATLDLGGGPRSFTSVTKSVGSYKGVEVKALLSFSYDYDREENKLTIRGNDDRTEEQLRITLFLSGAPDQALGQGPSLVYHVMPNDIGHNLPLRDVWAAHVGQNSDLLAALSTTARACNDRLVQGAIDAGVTAVLQLGTPPIVTLDNLDDWKLMLGEPVATQARTDRLAEVIRVQFKVNSIYKGTVTWANNTEFANVDGSTDDPKHGVSSWLDLWREKCNGDQDPTNCTSYNFFGNGEGTCSTYFVGGHVITGKVVKTMPKGSTIYIFPICKTHNNNDNVYMKIIYNSTGLEMKNYLEAIPPHQGEVVDLGDRVVVEAGDAPDIVQPVEPAG